MIHSFVKEIHQHRPQVKRALSAPQCETPKRGKDHGKQCDGVLLYKFALLTTGTGGFAKAWLFRVLTRLRAATIKEFDTIARLETQAIDAYNDAHHYRAMNPLTHLYEDEAPVGTFTTFAVQLLAVRCLRCHFI